MSVRTTFAPCDASNLASAAPWPLAAPVTIATFPCMLVNRHLLSDISLRWRRLTNQVGRSNYGGRVIDSTDVRISSHDELRAMMEQSRRLTRPALFIGHYNRNMSL